MQLGFDWGGLVTGIATAGVQIAGARSNTKLIEAQRALENAQALALQTASLANMQPPAASRALAVSAPLYASPGGVPVYQSAPLPSWAVPAGIGAAVLVVLLALRR